MGRHKIAPIPTLSHLGATHLGGSHAPSQERESLSFPRLLSLQGTYHGSMWAKLGRERLSLGWVDTRLHPFPHLATWRGPPTLVALMPSFSLMGARLSPPRERASLPWLPWVRERLSPPWLRACGLGSPRVEGSNPSTLHPPLGRGLSLLERDHGSQERESLSPMVPKGEREALSPLAKGLGLRVS